MFRKLICDKLREPIYLNILAEESVDYLQFGNKMRGGIGDIGTCIRGGGVGGKIHSEIEENPITILVPVLQKWASKRSCGVAAIDGMCGSGKTTLASMLQEKLGWRIFHMDDYYLPFSKRDPDWRNIPAGNIDLTRFKEEVLVPASEGKSVRTSRYNCREDRSEMVESAAQPFTIVEGSYCCHPFLREQYGITVFLSVTEELQQRRLQIREKDNYKNYTKIWIPMEFNYFEACKVREQANVSLLITADGKCMRDGKEEK